MIHRKVCLPGGIITPMKPPTEMLTRRELAERWRCSIETIKRRERAGILHMVLLGARMPRYRRSDIEGIEKPKNGDSTVYGSP